jgi:hypothetical protein
MTPESSQRDDEQQRALITPLHRYKTYLQQTRLKKLLQQLPLRAVGEAAVVVAGSEICSRHTGHLVALEAHLPCLVAHGALEQQAVLILTVAMMNECHGGLVVMLV